MANILSGKILVINPTQTIASRNGGQPVVKREFVIRAMRFNPDDGTPELSERNTPIIEISGQDRVGVLDNFKVGDFVKVGFVVEGRSVTNQDGTTKYFNSVRAIRVEPMQGVIVPEHKPQAQKPATAPQPVQGQVAAPQGQQADLPF